MSALLAALIPLIVAIAAGAIAIAVVEKFSPDALVTTIVRWVVFALVLIFALKTLIPMLA